MESQREGTDNWYNEYRVFSFFFVLTSLNFSWHAKTTHADPASAQFLQTDVSEIFCARLACILLLKINCVMVSSNDNRKLWPMTNTKKNTTAYWRQVLNTELKPTMPSNGIFTRERKPFHVTVLEFDLNLITVEPRWLQPSARETKNSSRYWGFDFRLKGAGVEFQVSC